MSDEKSQHDRFIETARAIGADEDEAAFKAKLAVIARQKIAKPPSQETQARNPENNGGKR